MNTQKRHRYFAVLDPLDTSKMSYWYLPDKGRKKDQLQPWPPLRNKWGSLYDKDIPEHSRENVNAEVFRAFLRAYFDRVRTAREEVERIISEDPGLAAARFSHLAIRCCYCGKTLTEERSKIYGVGPECRQGASPDYLARLIEMVKAVYAPAALSPVR